VESWISLAFCQALVAIWVCAELLLKRRLRWCIVKCFHIRAALFGTIWQFASFLFVCGIMWISYTFNKEHSPNSWWVPNVVTLVCFYAAYKAIRRFCPETSRRIFALGIIDEETNEGEPPPIESLPDYWTNKKLRQPKNFDQMVYVEEERLAVFDELLNATYKGVCTQDRPCPKTDSPCKKTPGGCACNKVGGTPGLPTAYVARRVIRVEDSEMWVKYDQKRQEINEKRQGDNWRVFDPPLMSDEIVTNNPDVFLPVDHDMCEGYLWHGTSVRIALAIAQNDFRIDLAGSGAGTMYGRGAYLAESSTKADEYARDEPGGYYDGIRALVLCRVFMGKYYYTTQRDEKAQEKWQNGEFDSTLGDRAKSVGTFREFHTPTIKFILSTWFCITGPMAMRTRKSSDKQTDDANFLWNCHCIGRTATTIPIQILSMRSTASATHREI